MTSFHLVLLVTSIALLLAPTHANKAALNSLLQRKETEVTVILESFNTSYNRYKCSNGSTETCESSSCCSRLACSASLLDSRCVQSFGGCRSNSEGRYVSFASSTIFTSANNLNEQDVLQDVDMTRGLDSAFLTNAETGGLDDSDLKWQYVGTPSGMWRLFPGIPQEQCYDYDPRLRPWYVAATSGPKDVVLVIDKSASMSAASRMELTKQAVATVLDTLTLSDHVAVITFDAFVNQVCGGSVRCGSLSPATSAVINELKAKVNAISPSQTTNFEGAINKAYDILTDSVELTSNCHTAILFLTDGDPTAGVTNQAQLEDILDRRQTTFRNRRNREAVWFTYSLGRLASEDIPKSFACRTNGIWSPIVDADANGLRSQMGHYYDYFSSLRADGDTHITWVEPYLDASGAGLMTTASRALYDRTVTPPKLIGVVGVDLLMEDIERVEPDFALQLQVLKSRSFTCPRVSASECELKVLRQTSYVDRSTTSTQQLCGSEPTSCPTETLGCASGATGQLPTAQHATVCSAGQRASYEEEACSGCAVSTSSSSDSNTGVVVAVVVVLLLIVIVFGFVAYRRRQESSRLAVRNQPAVISSTHSTNNSTYPSASTHHHTMSNPPATVPSAPPTTGHPLQPYGAGTVQYPPGEVDGLPSYNQVINSSSSV
eukprot:TRINITY_DN7704_c0_g1_i1.p1 TRINITY_DN7704_c0_g1~~TRINITY_DN7704_c0_g1_i1.p1  ORF type:complete len:661 (+),score=122.10 TRINITY_DN7704_c0_g1_i1:35-2017(+)